MRAQTGLFAALGSLFCLVLLAGCGQPDVSVSKVDAGRLGTVRLLVPEGAKETYPVILIVNKSSDATFRYAQQIAADGHLVTLIDWSVAAALTGSTTEPCHFPVGDLEDFIQQTQTKLAFPKYVPPVVIGIGEGADAAYALLAQAPSLAIAGAIGIGRTGLLDISGSLCNEVAEKRQDPRSESYGPKESTNGWWRSVVDPTQSEEAHFAKATSHGDESHPNTVVVAAAADVAERVGAALAAANAIVKRHADAPLTDLPLTPIKSAKPGDVLAIIISGDGGWRDLDRQIGFELAKGDISVIGVDSLHYFWQTKSPQKIADDLTRIIDFYSKAWNTSHVLLIGYSFGADIVPSAVDHMTAETRARIEQISLLGMSDTTDFEIHVAGWLGVQPKDQPIEPDAAKLDMSRVQCFYGMQEDVTFCTSPTMKRAEIYGLPGGHHFDGAYAHLTDLIVAGLHKRLAHSASRDGVPK